MSFLVFKKLKKPKNLKPLILNPLENLANEKAMKHGQANEGGVDHNRSLLSFHRCNVLAIRVKGFRVIVTWDVWLCSYRASVWVYVPLC